MSVAELELVPDEVVVHPLAGDELRVGAALGHAPGVHHYYAVGFPDGGEAVRHHHYRAPAVESGEVLHYGALVGGVERVGGLVETKALAQGVAHHTQASHSALHSVALRHEPETTTGCHPHFISVRESITSIMRLS